MSADREPPRWTQAGSDAPSELRDLLQGGRAPLGSPDELTQLSGELARALGAEAGLGAASVVAPARAALSGARWAAWLAAGAASSVAIWYFAVRSPPAPLPPSAPVPVQLAPVPPAPAPVAPPVPQPQPAPPAVMVPTPSEPEPAVRQRPASGPVRPAAPSETVLLERAQSLLAAKPGSALQLTREHQRRFPKGVLAEEREAIAIEALRRLGRQQAASERAAAFRARYPGSVHEERVRGTP